VIRIRLSHSDLNRLLGMAPEADIRYVDGAFEIIKRAGPVRVTVWAHLELRGHDIKLALPFGQMKVDGAGALLGRATALIWPRWIEPWLERTIADKLAEQGLPWEMVWVDTADDPQRGRMGLLTFSPRILNDWLRGQDHLGTLAPRLVSVTADRDGVTLGVAMAPRGEAAPPWRNEAGDGHG